jgi:hypothetical protein
MQRSDRRFPACAVNEPWIHNVKQPWLCGGPIAAESQRFATVRRLARGETRRMASRLSAASSRRILGKLPENAVQGITYQGVIVDHENFHPAPHLRLSRSSQPRRRYPDVPGQSN